MKRLLSKIKWLKRTLAGSMVQLCTQHWASSVTAMFRQGMNKSQGWRLHWAICPVWDHSFWEEPPLLQSDFISQSNLRSWTLLFWDSSFLTLAHAKSNSHQTRKKNRCYPARIAQSAPSARLNISHVGLTSKQPQLSNQEIKNNVWQIYCFLSLQGNVCPRQAHLKHH